MKNRNQTLSETLIFITITIFYVFLFYFHTLFYSIKAFDEIMIFKESHVPVCFSLSEICELISLLGLHQHFESSNMLYSNISSLRCDPFCAFLHLITQFLFQKNSFYYHFYGLILHLINTALVFLILNKISFLFLKDTNNKVKIFFVSILTILWSTCPTNIESILLVSNANITLSYGLSLLTFYLYLRFLSDYKLSNLFKFVSLFTTFIFALLIAEFHFMLPFILFVYTIGVNFHFTQNSIKKNLYSSLVSISPILLATIIYITLFLLSSTKINIQTHSSLNLIFERVFWLSPQILFHFIKLLFLPIKLSVDQTLLVKIADSLFDPYAIFCTGFVLLLLVVSIISLFNAYRKFPFFFIIFFPFLLSLLPYSQILAPLYNIASERYLYFPSFILIFGIAHYIFFLVSKNINNKKFIYVTTGIILVILILYSVRGYIRTLDWKDNVTLYSSAINATKNPLFKAYRYRLLTEKIFSQYPEREVELTFQNLAIQNLKKAIILYKRKVKKLQDSIPEIVKVYGLDPKTLLAKSAYVLALCDFNLKNDPKHAYKIMAPYTQDLSILDSSAITSYAALLYYYNKIDQTEYVLKKGYELRPYSTRIIISLCDLIYIKYGDLKTIEDYCLKAFKYFPYDSYIIYALANTYRLMNNHERYAYFSYLQGLRNHSIEALQTAYNEYLFLNDKNNVQKVKNKISFIERELQKRNEKK